MATSNNVVGLHAYNKVPFSCDVLANATNPPSVPSTHSASRSTDEFLPLLPASRRTKDDNLAVPTSLNSDPHGSLLLRELDVRRLNKIHNWLWTTGRPMPARPLHRQKLMGREIVITEQMDMHLLWIKSQMFLKPIPRFLLWRDFWEKRLVCNASCSCVSKSARPSRHELRACAFGFLLSYAALIAYESDYHIARELHLLPEQVSWENWKIFVQQLLSEVDMYNNVNKRFWYGELRLGRINMIYRLTGASLLRGYETQYGHYSDLLSENFGWLLTAFAYVAVVLSAMQVGLSTNHLEEDRRFHAASYVFTVFSILGPVVALLALALLLGALVIYNWIATVKYHHARLRRMSLVHVDPKGHTNQV